MDKSLKSQYPSVLIINVKTHLNSGVFTKTLKNISTQLILSKRANTTQLLKIEDAGLQYLPKVNIAKNKQTKS